MRMRGLNMGGWLSQIDAIEEKDPQKFPGIDKHIQTFIGENDFANVKKWGFDHVRVPVDSYIFFTDDEAPLENRLKTLDCAVEYAKKSGLKFILDLHECPGHDFHEAAKTPIQKLFVEGDDTYIKKTEIIWTILSERYGQNDHVIFETLNEPVAPTADIWNSISERFCKVIRKYAPKNTIMTGSNMWNTTGNFAYLKPVEDDNIIYVAHFYEPLLFTHQLAPWIDSPEIKIKRDYPGDYGEGIVRKFGMAQSAGVWNKDRLAELFEPVNEFRKKYNAQVICNEFGVFALVELQAQLRWYNDLLSILKEMEIGFTYWNYKNLDFGIISIGESLHEKLPQYNNPDRINYPILEVLQKY